MSAALEQAFPFLSADGHARLREHGREQSFDAGDVLVEEGTPHSALFVILEGNVRIEKSHLGGRIPIAHLGPGQIVGEVSFLDGSPTSASAVAADQVSALVLEGFDELLESDAALAAGFYRSLAVLLAGRLRFGNEERVVSALQWG